MSATEKDLSDVLSALCEVDKELMDMARWLHRIANIVDGLVSLVECDDPSFCDSRASKLLRKIASVKRLLERVRTSNPGNLLDRLPYGWYANIDWKKMRLVSIANKEFPGELHIHLDLSLPLDEQALKTIEEKVMAELKRLVEMIPEEAADTLNTLINMMKHIQSKLQYMEEEIDALHTRVNMLAARILEG